MPRPIFAIFEGGGAKGIAHVGALAACEKEDFYFVGVAGASAGAIIATLIAAGLQAKDLLDPKRPDENILAKYGESPVSLLGQAEWEEGRAFLDRAGLAFAEKGEKGRWRARWWLWRQKERLEDVLQQTGYLATEHAREVLNQILFDQLAFLRAEKGDFTLVPDRITFRDLDYTTHLEMRPLKIIAANVDARELAIFDRDRTPDVEVALAVAASIAIPGVFKPVMAPDRKGRLARHMDGGTVSNLPIWAFANDKLAFERGNPHLGPVPMVGFTLKPKEARPRPASTAAAAAPAADKRPNLAVRAWRGVKGFAAKLKPAAWAAPKKASKPMALPGWAEYARNGLSTMLDGSQSTIQEFVEDLRVIPLHCHVQVFDFDAGRRVLLGGYRDGYRCARRDLKHYLIRKPERVGRRLVLFRRFVVRKLKPFLTVSGQEGDEFMLRACVVERLEGAVFQVTHAVNMALDADDRLTLDSRGRASPAAFLEKEEKILPVWSGVKVPSTEPDYMTKYDRALANKRVQAIIALPIFPTLEAWDELDPTKRPDPCGVVAFDSNDGDALEAAFKDPTFISLVRAQSTLLYRPLTREPTRG